MTWPYPEIAAFTERQKGQIAHSQLRALAVGRGAIRHGLQTGRIRETFEGVYALGDLALPALWRENGAVLSCGEGAFVSRRAAVIAWGVLQGFAQLLDVTVPYERNPKRTGIRVHRSRVIDPRDVTQLDGVPIATPAFALFEAAPDLTFEQFERAFDDALTKKVMTLAGAQDTVRRHAGRPGSKLFGELAVSEHGLEITRSWLEQRMKSLVRMGDLPMPVLNLRKGRILPDFKWRAERVIVEVDGFRTHGTRRAFENDRARDAALAAEGWLVLRFTWRQLKYQPELVLARLAAVLAIRSQRAA